MVMLSSYDPKGVSANQGYLNFIFRLDVFHLYLRNLMLIDSSFDVFDSFIFTM